MNAGARALALGAAVVAHAAVLTGLGLARSGGASPANSHHIVEIRRLRFEPAQLIVAPGDSLTWVNHDIVSHTVSAADGAWSSGELGADESWGWIAGAADTISYYCEYHPTMRGRIVVMEAPDDHSE